MILNGITGAAAPSRVFGVKQAVKPASQLSCCPVLLLYQECARKTGGDIAAELAGHTKTTPTILVA